jgi:hypothetical protein
LRWIWEKLHYRDSCMPPLFRMPVPIFHLPLHYSLAFTGCFVQSFPDDNLDLAAIVGDEDRSQ